MPDASRDSKLQMLFRFLGFGEQYEYGGLGTVGLGDVGGFGGIGSFGGVGGYSGYSGFGR